MMPPAQPPNALSRLSEIRRLGHLRPRGLIADVDGTISEIAPTPEQATVSDGFRQHLRALLDTFDLVAAVSGRPVLDVRRMIGLEGLTYVGSHGLERWEGGRVWIARAAKRAAGKSPYVLDPVERRLQGIAGLYLEHKTSGLAIHFRSAADPEAVRQSILDALAGVSYAPLFSIIEGRQVVELRPRGRIQKGWAVTQLVRRHGLRSVIYLGDDVTDADAFGAIRRLRRREGLSGVGIAVVNPETPLEMLSGADLSLDGVGEVETFLAELLAASLRQGE